MTTEDRRPGTSGAGRARPAGDVPRMSEAEKRMAEWEARHDVAARGHRSPPDVLQHYLAHERIAHDRQPGGRRPLPGHPHPVDPRPTDAQPTDTGRHAQPEHAAHSATGPAETPPRGLLRRLFRRG